MISMPLSRQAPPGRRPRLLLVDDQPANIQALHRVFAGDCQVLMATDGARALQLCRERQPDLYRLLRTLSPEVGVDQAEVERELDTLLHVISHDMRAPLRGIQGFAGALHEDYAEKLDATGADYVRRICSGARRMDKMLDGVVRFGQGLGEGVAFRRVTFISGAVAV